MITMDAGYIIFINILILFAFFMGHTKWTLDVVNSQADLIDQILSHLKINHVDYNGLLNRESKI